MAINPKGVFATLRDAVNEFMNDDCPSMAAALSYYTAFSLPPLLILILVLLGTFVDPANVRGTLEHQIDTFMGPAGGAQIRQFLQTARPPGGDGFLPTIIGAITLAFGATGFFLSLQGALNKAWEVAPDPDQGGIRQFVVKRLFSFGMILGVAFLLLVSLALTAIISAFSARLESLLPNVGAPVLLEAVNLAITLPIIALLFALMFRTIPDAQVRWKHVRFGAIVTAALFLAGKTVLGIYIGRANPGEPYGAAGTLAVMLVWIYYSSMILLFGAELTQVVANHRGDPIIPEAGAVRTIVEKRRQLP
jgi:membrane protein